MSSILNFDFWNEYLGLLKSTFSVVLLLSYSAWLLSPEKWPFSKTDKITIWMTVKLVLSPNLCPFFPEFVLISANLCYMISKSHDGRSF